MLSEDTQIRHKGLYQSQHQKQHEVPLFPKVTREVEQPGEDAAHAIKITSLRNRNPFLMHRNQTSPIFALEEDMVLF